MEITSINASISGTTISISGTTVDNVLAVQLVIYDETGKNIVKMYSTDVTADHTFSATVPVETAGTYVVTAADYDGGTVVTTTVSESATPAKDDESDAQSTAGTPETGYHTIEKVESPTPEANASSSSSTLYICLGAGIVVAAVVVFGFRRALARRAK